MGDTGFGLHDLDEEEVLLAAERLDGVAHRTPILTSTSLDTLCGARLHFKCEHLQRTGSFKFRGAYNALLTLPEEARGVAAHSSGNWAAALALAARLRGLPLTVVMPADVPRYRRAAVRGLGATLVLSEPGLVARESALAEMAARTGAAVLHPYESAAAIAGHGTAVLELLQEVPGLDLVLVPVGGGGLAAGGVLASMVQGDGVRILGVEPELAASASHALRLGRHLPPADTDTVADGLRTSLGALPFTIVARHLSAILTVRDYDIVAAMRLVWERLKQVVEPSAAVTLAAILANKPRFAGLRVGIVLSGGNVELEQLPWVSGVETNDPET